MHMRQRHVLFVAVGGDAARGLGRQAQQGADGGRGLRARLQFEDLTEQRQRDDHCRGLEVHRHPSHRHERGRKHLRCHRRHHAIEEGRAGAQADQRPHVRAAVHDRSRAAREERPAGPQDNRQRQHHLDPALHGHVEPAQPVAEHRQHGDNYRQWQRPPEARLQVHEFRIPGFLQLGQHRLQCHAALRAVARVALTDLRVHGAGVGASGCGLGGRRCRHRHRLRGQHVLRRLGAELRQALPAAEVVRPTVMLDAVRRLFGYRHAAHRLPERDGVGGRRRILVRMGVRAAFVAFVVGVCMHVHGFTPPWLPKALCPIHDRHGARVPRGRGTGASPGMPAARQSLAVAAASSPSGDIVQSFVLNLIGRTLGALMAGVFAQRPELVAPHEPMYRAMRVCGLPAG